MAGPFEGIRVADVTTVLLGPYAAQILGDQGADVIKVEAPPKGDSTRYLGPGRHVGMSGAFMNLNRNKRSIMLDLKQAPARAALARLVAGADVFLHNMRAQAVERLGFGYEAVRAMRPDIVYCGCYGYSQQGPYRDKPAYDDLIQTRGGLAAMFARVDGTPRLVPTVMVDKLVGLTAAQAISAALFHRLRTGQGQFVEVPMFETMAAFMSAEHISGRAFEPAISDVGYERLTTPFRRPYRTKDGYVTILPYTDRHWQGFFRAAGRPELADDPRFADHASRNAHIGELYRLLDELAPHRTTAEWEALLEPLGVPVAPMMDLADLLDDPHLEAFGLWHRLDHPSEGATVVAAPPVTMSASPGSIRLPAPRLGEHGPAILAELGYAADEIAGLRASGAVAVPGEG